MEEGMRMSHVYITTVLAIILIHHLFPTWTVADVFTTTWTYQLDLVEGEYVSSDYSIGQLGTFTATYEDDAIIGTKFDAGPDFIPFNENDRIIRPSSKDEWIISDLTNVHWDIDEAFQDYVSLVRTQDVGWNDRNYVYHINHSDYNGIIMRDRVDGYLPSGYRQRSLWEMRISSEIGGHYWLHFRNEYYAGTVGGWVEYQNNLLSGTVTMIEHIGGEEPIPEPATMLLFGTGLAGLAGYRKRKAMKK